MDGLSYISAATLARSAVVSDGDNRWYFSVTARSLGRPLGGTNPVRTEALAKEADSDVFSVLVYGAPLAPTVAAPGSIRHDLDGDGDVNGTPDKSLGLIEIPNLRCDKLGSVAQVPTASRPNYIFHSFSWPSLTQTPLTVLGGQVHGADILVSTTTFPQTIPHSIYVPYGLLGLYVKDDIDALIVIENGQFWYQGPGNVNGPTHGEPGPGDGTAPQPPVKDQVFFSLTPDSPSISRIDSRLGLPIEPGDILVPPVSAPSTTAPRIFIPAESLGLRTLRSGSPAADDVDALEVTPRAHL